MIRACGFLRYSVGLETTSLPHHLYRLTCAFGCVGSTCLCAFDVDFSLVRMWTCIGVVHSGELLQGDRPILAKK